MDMSSWLMLSLHTISFVRQYEKLKEHDSQEELYSLLGRWFVNKDCFFSALLLRISICIFIVLCSVFWNYFASHQIQSHCPHEQSPRIHLLLAIFLVHKVGTCQKHQQIRCQLSLENVAELQQTRLRCLPTLITRTMRVVQNVLEIRGQKNQKIRNKTQKKRTENSEQIASQSHAVQIHNFVILILLLNKFLFKKLR